MVGSIETDLKRGLSDKMGEKLLNIEELTDYLELSEEIIEGLLKC
jgi:hypothetical protein